MRPRTGIIIEITVHAFCWIALTFLLIHNNAMSFHYLKGDLMTVPIMVGTSINILLFYANLFYLFPKYKSKKFSVVGYSLWAIFVVIVLSVVENTFDYFYAVNKYPGEKVNMQYGEILITSFINVFFLLLSVVYSITRDWIKMEVVKRKLIEENLKLELNYLKSQINPHFLFNSLNNLYSIAIKNNDTETAAGLSKLSTLMRFMLDKSEKTTVQLNEEIEYLKSYVEMQKLRFLEEDEVDISFTTNGETQAFSIPPFLLINFVENAFKHGIDYKKTSQIDIQINVVENELIFRIENTNHSTMDKEANSQIGLDNVEKRLALMYGNDYDLKIESNSQKHIVILAIKSL